VSSEIIEFKQTGLTKESLQSAGKVTIISAIFLAFSLSGLPAFCASVIWTVLNMQSILHVSATSAQVFKYCYLMSIGTALPPIALLAAFAWTTRNVDKLSANLMVSEDGVRWKPHSVATGLLLKVFGEQSTLVPWSRIAIVSAGEQLCKLRSEYGLVVDQEAYAKHSRQSVDSEYLTLGQRQHINFVGKNKKGLLKRMVSIHADAMTPESKLQLLSAVQQWAPELAMTEKATAMLTGPTLAKRDVQFTDIWLEVMDASRERKRQSDLAAGDLMNHERYRILNKMATGGQANLYLAADTQLPDTNVVLKEFVLSSAGTEGALNCLAEFENESKIMQSLDSAYFCKLHEIFVEDGRAYLVLDHIPARSLRQIVAESGKLSPPHVVTIAKQLAAAISYLHHLDPPVIHRDISPDNILLSESKALSATEAPTGTEVTGTEAPTEALTESERNTGSEEVKLIDFSVSTRGESDIAGSAVGKPAYISPDQFRGLAKRTNDIYSFGATLFFLLTGEDPEPICQARPSSVCANVGTALDDIVARCTVLDTANGYASIDEVCQALNSITPME